MSLRSILHVAAVACLTMAAVGATTAVPTKDMPFRPAAIRKAYLLSDARHAALTFSQQGGTFSIELPENALAPIASVVCLECAAE